MPVLKTPTSLFPPIACFALAKQAGVWELEAFESWQKQTLRNRFYINTAQGVKVLSYPVTNTEAKSIKDIQLCNAQAWQLQLWRSIRSAYGKAPFFEHYAHYIEEPLCRHTFKYLWDLNGSFLPIMQKLLKLSFEIKESTSFELLENTNSWDVRGSFKGRFIQTPLLMDVAYPQVFGNKFEEGLSCIDLLFCQGPQSLHILEEMFQHSFQHIRQ